MFTASLGGSMSQLLLNNSGHTQSSDAHSSFSNALLRQAQSAKAEASELMAGTNRPTTLPSNQAPTVGGSTSTDGTTSSGSSNANGSLGSNQGSSSGTNGSASPSSGNAGTAASLSSTATSATSMFNAQGNLSNSLNLKDFALLSAQSNLVNQALSLARNINVTQMAAMQPAVMVQIGILQRLLSLLENNMRQRSSEIAGHTASSTNASAAAADDVNNQALAYVILDRFFKLVDPQNKHLALSRFFKKGPLGENIHDEDTDDEFGTTYADIDGEIDYIKRPRKEKTYMDFHYSMIT